MIQDAKNVTNSSSMGKHLETLRHHRAIPRFPGFVLNLPTRCKGLAGPAIPPFLAAKSMNLTLLTLILTGILATIACVGTSSESAKETLAVTVAPSTANVSPRLEVSVGPTRQECYGPFRRMCLVVDDRLFYSEIDGFTHEPGHEYRLRVERYDTFPGQTEPPQDAGRHSYRLIEEVSKTPVDGEVTEATVAPARVTCPGTDELCLLVNGAPLRGVISGFEFRAGYEYRIRYEEYGDGS